MPPHTSTFGDESAAGGSALSTHPIHDHRDRVLGWQRIFQADHRLHVRRVRLEAVGD
jgi:hypothetical protein